MEPLTRCIASLTPAEMCQGFYVVASAAILAINVLPADLRSVLIEYGARQQESKVQKQKGLFPRLARLLEVPHSWFLHFYVLSVAWSVFWAWQYLTQGAVMEWLARAQVRDGHQTSVELSRVFVAWGLMTLQGVRRLYESLIVTKSGSSHMSSLHWIFGLLFYTDMSISVWIEGSGGLPGFYLVVFASTLLTFGIY